MKLKSFVGVLLLGLSGSAYSGIEELQYLTSNYLAFAESQLAQYMTNPIYEESRVSCPNTIHSYRQKIEIALELRNTFRTLAYLRQLHPMDDDEYVLTISRQLRSFLKQRFAWLEERHKDYQVFLKQGPDLRAGKRMAISYIHTSPKDVKRYPVGSLYHEIAVMALTDFRLLNRIIRELYDILPSYAIVGETKKLIRASVSLHSFLLRETTEVGYPEQGFMVNLENNRKGVNLTGDLVYHFSYISTTPYWIPDLMLGAPSGQKNLVWLTQAEAYRLGGELPLPNKAVRTLKTSTPRVGPPAFPLPSFKPFRIAKQKAEGLLGEVRSEIDEAEATNLPVEKNWLPADTRFRKPAPLRSKRVTRKAKARQEATQVTELLVNSEVSSETSESLEKKAIRKVSHSEMERELEAESDVRKGVQTVEPEVAVQAAFNLEEVSLEKPLLQKDGFEEQEAPLARFHRVFHAHQTPASEPQVNLEVLKRTDYAWLHDLFHHKLKVVKYQDFEKVWKRLGGEINREDAVGSHFELRNASHRVVGGVFAHSESQEYSRHYHPVLRDAFSMLGISKNSF